MAVRSIASERLQEVKHPEGVRKGPQDAYLGAYARHQLAQDVVREAVAVRVRKAQAAVEGPQLSRAAVHGAGPGLLAAAAACRGELYKLAWHVLLQDLKLMPLREDDPEAALLRELQLHLGQTEVPAILVRGRVHALREIQKGLARQV